ncbi:type IV pilin protein [Paenibacillus montanisoli]|uniref:Type II secretory pathway pseudopilin PulG n=1 Tax=Paenibacillus montanisoli TaxID=2081970 RepID=A0A328TW70_9BACL|nr:prepilin-type N-terminal cleavage/methylation domain-containing protein [Paenibacillus montanisoli]RAP74747.1 type II secretory pathway pseudopilin PulG [Paenibacillus montanisoli]
MLKRLLKNQKGLTLIELLAVVIILGIVSAIAVPSIGKIIDNSKKDAHVANAVQMINSTKLLIAGGDATLRPSNGSQVYIPLNYLVGASGNLDALKNPDGGTYNSPTADVVSTSAVPTGSYVKVSLAASPATEFTYDVKLVPSSGRGVQTGSPSAGNPIAEANLTRSAVN